jgi:nitrate reductase gamma subunit
MDWSMFYYFIMVPMVYASFGILILGIILKLTVIFFAKRFRGSFKTFPTHLPRPIGVLKDAFLIPVAWKKNKALWTFLTVFHFSFLLLFIGHLELIKDLKILQIIPHEVFIGAGAVGIALIISVLYFLFRRFKSPWREISVPEDFLLLLLLFLAFVTGSHLNLAARYGVAGFDIPLEEYRAYLSSMITLNPKIPDGISGSPHYILIVLHILFANIVLMLLPFSKIIHMIFAFLSLNLQRK